MDPVGSAARAASPALPLSTLLPPPPTSALLPPSHPLMAELASLRQQLAQYQRAAHQASLQVQSGRLELDLIKEDNTALRGAVAALKLEAETLRTTPEPPVAVPPSNALAELSLAHRRLSSKLDLTEHQLSASQLELAAAKQELHRIHREREGDRAAINELRRVEDDREEEIEWERGERRRLEEQKKLCDLALAEYKKLVHSLDPTAIPPPEPRGVPNDILQTPPELGTASPTHLLAATTDDINTDVVKGDAVSTPAASADAISNLLIGQRGVHRLFRDFTSALTSKDKELHGLQTRVDEVKHTLAICRDQLSAETALRVEAQASRDRAMRDDASAAKVVERYMTFSQKSHQTVHMHLGQLRARSAATQASLRHEVAALRQRVRGEVDRAARLRAAADEMSEELGRESAGRRREVALRLQLIAVDEARARRAEAWLDRVRRARAGPEAAVVEPDILAALVDDAVELLASGTPNDATSAAKQRGWRMRLLGRLSSTSSDDGGVTATPADESLARVLLAEELVTTLVRDVQVETEKRVDLERQRVAWLAREAEQGIAAAHDDGEAEHIHHLMFDVDDEGDEAATGLTVSSNDAQGEDDGARVDLQPSPIPTPSPLEPSPLLDQLTQLFAPLEARYRPLQKSLHDQSVSLAALRSALPTTPELSSPTATTQPSGRKRASSFRALSVRPVRTAHDHLVTLLDGLHEVIEDARVDVEIAMADEDRVYHGFEALLGVGGASGAGSSVVHKTDVLRDAQDYVAHRTGTDATGGKNRGDTLHARLDARVGDIEHDLMMIKRTLHELEGMEVNSPVGSETAGGGGVGTVGSTKRDRGNARKSVWQSIPLRTISPTSRPFPSLEYDEYGTSSSSVTDEDGSDDDADSRLHDATQRNAVRPSTVSLLTSVGRSFSSGVMGAPRRVSGLAGGIAGGIAGGLYRGPSASGSGGGIGNGSGRRAGGLGRDDVGEDELGVGVSVDEDNSRELLAADKEDDVE